MGEIIPILFIIVIWFVVNGGKKAKKISANRPGPAKTPISEADAASHGADAMKRAREWMGTAGEKPKEAGRSAPREFSTATSKTPPGGEGSAGTEYLKPASREGAGMEGRSGAFSAKGRPTGSKTVAVSLREEEKPMVAPKLAAAAPHLIERSASLSGAAGGRSAGLRLSKEQLRAAVVMSEILDKPVSLRAKKRMY